MSQIQDVQAITALLDAQKQHQSIKIYGHNRKSCVFSRVIGFDYYDNTLLIENFLPPIHAFSDTTTIKQTYWVQLRFEGGFLNLLCCLKSKHHDLVSLRITDHQLSNNQRWFSRIHFDQNSGPKMALSIDNEPTILANIRDLSAHGAAIEVYAKDVRRALTSHRHCHCKIRFSESFVMSFDAGVKQCCFKRKPCCRTTARLLFKALSDTHCAQLQQFIDALSPSEPRISSVQYPHTPQPYAYA